MNVSGRFPVQGVSLLAVIIGCAFHSVGVYAAGKGAHLTMGDVTQGGGNVSTSSNPASGAFDRQFLSADTDVAGY